MLQKALRMKKIWFIIISVVFLGIYVNFNKIAERFDSRIMGAEVLSMEEIDALCVGREDAFMEPEITINGGAVAYDADQNMLLVPQNLSEESFDGKLDVQCIFYRNAGSPNFIEGYHGHRDNLWYTAGL